MDQPPPIFGYPQISFTAKVPIEQKWKAISKAIFQRSPKEKGKLIINQYLEQVDIENAKVKTM